MVVRCSTSALETCLNQNSDESTLLFQRVNLMFLGYFYGVVEFIRYCYCTISVVHTAFNLRAIDFIRVSYIKHPRGIEVA